MAKQQGNTQSRGTASKQPGSARSSTAQRGATDQRSDQERQLDLSRERSKASTTETNAASTAATPTRMATGSSATGTPTASTNQPRSQRSSADIANRSDTETSILPALMANPWLMTNAFLSNPYGFARAMNQEMDRLFSGGPADVSAYSQGATTAGKDSRALDVSRGARAGIARWSPQVEVRQTGNQLTVCADLPGLTAKDIDIQVDDGILTISGERQSSSEDKQEGYYRSERSYGSFSRSIALPDGVNEDQVRAKFNNGVLEVTIPVPEQRQRGRRVEIQSGG